MASSKNGAVRKLNDKRKAQVLKRVFGSDNRRGSRVLIGGSEHRTKTEYLINERGQWYGRGQDCRAARGTRAQARGFRPAMPHALG